MITENYVSFETAKLLKEKGFDIPVKYYYWKDTTIYSSCYNWNEETEKYSRPTLQMAMKWLREVHNCSIEITSNGYLMDNDATWECDIKFRHRLYFRHIQCQKTYEDCAETAIKYCLENLI